MPRKLTASSIEAALAAKFAAANAHFAAMHPEAAGVHTAQLQPSLHALVHQQQQQLHALPPPHPGVLPVTGPLLRTASTAHADPAAAAKLAALNAKLAQYQQPALGPGKHARWTCSVPSPGRRQGCLSRHCDERACSAACRHGGPADVAGRNGPAAKAFRPAAAAAEHCRLEARLAVAAAAAGARLGRAGGGKECGCEQGRAVTAQC